MCVDESPLSQAHAQPHHHHTRRHEETISGDPSKSVQPGFVAPPTPRIWIAHCQPRPAVLASMLGMLSSCCCKNISERIEPRVGLPLFADDSSSVLHNIACIRRPDAHQPASCFLRSASPEPLERSKPPNRNCQKSSAPCSTSSSSPYNIWEVFCRPMSPKIFRDNFDRGQTSIVAGLLSLQVVGLVL